MTNPVVYLDSTLDHLDYGDTLIFKKSENSDVVSIYIPELWKVEGDPATNCSDKVFWRH